MSVNVGRVVAGRYRIVAPLGTGTSAQVYLADDVTLQRSVAVKMLHPALATDEHFLARFRAEAQVVASISHPNVVVVHDSGVDEVPFLVTEYLAGGSLRGMVAAGHRLSVSQALVVGLDAARGLAHAHDRGLVHRDLKPANILFGDDGRLRIADFGLSRAVADAGLTEQDGSLVGTMRYAAPEQALGTAAGPKADVYALALALVEAVTGSVPFAGPDPRVALTARTAGDLEVPEQLGALRSAISAAGRLDPDARVDAEEFGIALLAASEHLPAPDPLPLVGARAEAAPEAPDERTMVAPAVAATAATDPVSAPPDGAGPATGGDTRRRWPRVLAALIALTLVAGAVAAFVLRERGAEVPELVGRQIGELTLIAEQNEWVLDEKKTRRNGTEPGEIVSTDPPAGARLGSGEILVVVVSEGNELTDRPQDLAGRRLEEVVVDLERAGLEYTTNEVFHEEVPEGFVIGTDGDVDAELPRGEAVPLLVSAGPAPREIPPIDEDTQVDDYVQALEDLQLVPVLDEVFDDDVAEGTVMAVTPAPGEEVRRGSEVTVRVSKGPDLVEVPDLRGLKLSEAEERLEEAGLVLGQDCCASNGRVVGSDPGAGTMVRRGTAVNVFLAR